jgi:hypothetical protein
MSPSPLLVLSSTLTMDQSDADVLHPFQDIQLQAWVTQIITKEQAIEAMPNGDEKEASKQQWCKYVLTGIDESDANNPTQARVGVMKYVLKQTEYPTFARDYDSLLGFTPNIPTSEDLFVWPVARFADTLTEPLHIKVRMQVNGQVILSFSLTPIQPHTDFSI